MSLAIRFHVGVMALLLAANTVAQEQKIQRQQKAPNVVATPPAAPLATQSQPTAQDRYQQRAGIVIEMAPSPQRNAATRQPRPAHR